MLEKIIRVRSCCGCSNLRIGCIALAIVGIVFAIVFWLILLLSFFRMERENGSPEENDNQRSDPFQIITIACFLVEISPWTLLLIGSVKRNAKIVKISFILDIIGVVVKIIVPLILAALLTAMMKSVAGDPGLTIWIIVLIPYLPLIAFFIYGAIVILSFYDELQQNYDGLEQMAFTKSNEIE